MHAIDPRDDAQPLPDREIEHCVRSALWLSALLEAASQHEDARYFLDDAAFLIEKHWKPKEVC